MIGGPSFLGYYWLPRASYSCPKQWSQSPAIFWHSLRKVARETPQLDGALHLRILYPGPAAKHRDCPGPNKFTRINEGVFHMGRRPHKTLPHVFTRQSGRQPKQTPAIGTTQTVPQLLLCRASNYSSEQSRKNQNQEVSR